MIQPEQQLRWRRGAQCTGGNCVEVAKVDGRVLVRNSAQPDVVVTFSRDEWAVFVEGAHEFR